MTLYDGLDILVAYICIYTLHILKPPLALCEYALRQNKENWRANISKLSSLKSAVWQCNRDLQRNITEVFYNQRNLKNMAIIKQICEVYCIRITERICRCLFAMEK